MKFFVLFCFVFIDLVSKTCTRQKYKWKNQLDNLLTIDSLFSIELQPLTLVFSLISYHHVQFLTYLLQATCCTFSTEYILHRLIRYNNYM